MAHDRENVAQLIKDGRGVLGVEFGSTRIKATLVGPDCAPIASGAHGWENTLVDGVWTYPIEEVWKGLAACYRELAESVKSLCGQEITRLAAIGFSGMMHGYVALDADDELLVPFRTWRNNITEGAAATLTELFDYPIAQRWSIAHLYQAVLNGEPHLKKLQRITTIAGYVHGKLTGSWQVGIGEASGMFPIDPKTGGYDARLADRFDELAGSGETAGRLPASIRSLLPEIVAVGQPAGTLTAAGARLVDPDGKLQAGVALCPPEGDAQTGMVATNSVRPRTGNVSAGTSVFAMLVLEKPLSAVHPEIDLVLTPDGHPVAMAHSNNCTSDFDAWIGLFGQAARALGASVSDGDLYAKLMPLALNGDTDRGGMLAYGYVSGEHVTGFSQGRPLFVRRPDAQLALPDFIRTHLFASLGALRTGLNILTEEEGVRVEEIRGHGGFFKTPEVGQRIMAAATRTPISVLETAGEGGPWGMALLAAYLVREKADESLAGFLERVFASSEASTVQPADDEVGEFNRFFERYTDGLAIEAAAVEHLQ
ncbi:MAG: ATPase [Spirochaetaceae bacterium]|nr:MAG: ATPase [Spirochaetaceae bacterium]